MIIKITFHLIAVKNSSIKGIQILDDKVSFTLLNPIWVTGFTDAEGSFIISIIKSSERRTGWRVQAIFAIQLHERDIATLYRIKSFFGVGTIVVNKKRGHANYAVRNVKDIYSFIIPHFNKYPLLTQKQADFELFQTIVNLIIQNQHTTPDGLKKIVELRASLNKGISGELAKNFPNIQPVERPKVELTKNIDLNWLVGFIDGEGCFSVYIFPSKTKIGFAVQLNFNIVQHIRDSSLLINIQRCLGCGSIIQIPEKSRVNFVVVKLTDIINILLPIFSKYPLQGTKNLNFMDFCKIVDIMKNKRHLTSLPTPHPTHVWGGGWGGRIRGD
jgi:hypothetical protein